MGEYQEEIHSLLSQVVGIAGHFGHWAPGMPIARGKGAPGLLDYVNRMAELQGHCTALDRLDQVIDWEKMSETTQKNERNERKKSLTPNMSLE